MCHKTLRILLAFLPLFFLIQPLEAQIAMPGEGNNKAGLGAKTQPTKPNEYIIGGITISGNRFLDEDLLMAVTGLTVGQKLRLPGDEGIARAIKNLWKQDLFSDVRVSITKVLGDKVFLDIHIEERPRLSKYNFRGIKKNEAQELKDKVGLVKSKVVTEATKRDAVSRIRKFFVDKGFGQTKVSVKERPDTTVANSVILTFDIAKGNKTKINQINIAGNTVATDSRLKRTFSATKEMPRLTLHRADAESIYPTDKITLSDYAKSLGFLSITKTIETLDPYFRFKGIFSSSKFNDQKYQDDKQNLIDYYNSLGYRDASIVDDTVYNISNGNINIDLTVKEGHRYYFGDIKWRGNTKYPDSTLADMLGIKKGDVYNQELLNKRLGVQPSPDGGDVSSLYMDDGYLFFRIEPRETSIVGDTINFEMAITEGPQATIKNVTISGNNRTNEHVIRRELRTLPGNKFSRSDLIRTNREIANLGFFDQEKIGMQPIPHPEDGTVDIAYNVVEKSSDQLQLSAGFGGGIRFYGNIGIMFNNFSLRNILRPKTWDPLPMGDGQKFSINYQSNGSYYNSFNFSFTEPWLGGKKPNALTTGLTYSRFSGNMADPNSSYLRMLGGNVSISRRLKWPDDNFVFTMGVDYRNYMLKAYPNLLPNFTDGNSNDLSLRMVIARYSVDQPLYPRSGSNISLTMSFTPPVSSFSSKDYKDANPTDKYKWIEYHKYRFTAEWYKNITGKFVLKLATKYGFLGYYNPDIGYSPFGRFQLGGDGLSGQSYFIGRDIISQRGYEIYASNATIFNKYTAEIRYPFSMSPTSTIYGLVFVDAANAWGTFKDYNPFKLNRDAGVGVRLFLPMFGLLGLDYGIGFDRFDRSTGNTSFKDISKFTFMLGFEPD
ncbi:MAG: outer membrane protein assembly factor [Bacteroidetes bacterium]|nr:outer membrane protein assembly factor [Bacteroidota bacterium]MBS1740588.1 outer membrane protein assembly factor [Bacteroidota bacterium]MBS1775089.1 outer membrane protein assembly factor [Bacteroidota bacterium]